MKAAYKYQAEDVDELNFEVGEIIQVVEYDDPEEQVGIISVISEKIEKKYESFVIFFAKTAYKLHNFKKSQERNFAEI